MVTDPDYLLLHELLAHSSLPVQSVTLLTEQLSTQLSATHKGVIVLELKKEDDVMVRDIDANSNVDSERSEDQTNTVAETVSKRPKLISNNRLNQGDIFKVSS